MNATWHEGAKEIYQSALKRLQTVVEVLDGGKDSPRNFEPWKKMVAERSGSCPAGMRWFLVQRKKWRSLDKSGSWWR